MLIKNKNTGIVWDVQNEDLLKRLKYSDEFEPVSKKPVKAKPDETPQTGGDPDGAALQTENTAGQE